MVEMEEAIEVQMVVEAKQVVGKASTMVGIAMWQTFMRVGEKSWRQMWKTHPRSF